MAMASRVISIGECMLELSGQGGVDWRLGYAGDTFNTLWALRALLPSDAATDYFSGFGDDPFSERQIAFLRDNGIGIATSPIIPGARPGLYAITLTGAERSFTYWRSEAAARQLASDPSALENGLSDRELIYFSGITLAILTDAARQTLLDAVANARRQGARVAFDPNYRPRLWPDVQAARNAIDGALAVVDIALPTFPDEQVLYGDASSEETAARLRKAGVSEVVVKNGEAPALVVDDRGEAIDVPALQVDAVDTTGAGDSFNGGYLAARLAGLPAQEAVQLGHRVAGAVVQVRGALAPFKMLQEAFASR